MCDRCHSADKILFKIACQRLFFVIYSVNGLFYAYITERSRGKCIHMKKHSTAKIILIYFFKTIGIMTLLVGVGILSYYLTMLYLKQTDRVERSTTYQHVIAVNAGPE